MADIQYYGTGRRKSSVARVRLVPGNGNVTINGRDMAEYFGKKTLEMIVMQPLELTETAGRFDVKVNATGGGTTGQAGAIRHGIARALLQADPDYRQDVAHLSSPSANCYLRQGKIFRHHNPRKRSFLGIFFCRFCGGNAPGRKSRLKKTRFSEKVP